MLIPLHTLEQYCNNRKLPSLPFNIEELNTDIPSYYGEIHRHDYFQIIFVDEGSAEQQIEYDKYKLAPESISVIFPKQIHSININTGTKGKVIMFDEVLFCSDILKKELSAYNVDLYKKLNDIKLNSAEYKNVRQIADKIHELHKNITPIKKELVRFYIKILLLQLIEDVHKDILPAKSLPSVNIYAEFKEQIEEKYTEIKTVSAYASLLGVTTKKLNEVCKTEAGMTALSVIHERIMVEIKRLLLFSGENNKEIAYKLGFTSPSAFNKFVYSKTRKTPTGLKESLTQKAK